MLNTAVLGLSVGAFLVLLAPALLKPTRYGQPLAQAYFRFVAKALRRPAIGLGKHGNLSLRQLSFDETYDQETITVGGVEKKITRTAKNVHRVGAAPFAFFDEVFGVTFDLRDVVIGRLEREHRNDGDMVRVRLETDPESGEVINRHSYVRAFFEVEGRTGLNMDLDESVRPIIDGSEKADWWDYMWEAVRRMYRHRQEPMSIMKLLFPFMVTGGALLFGYYVFGPGQMPGGETGGSAITVGTMLLPFGLGAIRERLPSREDLRERLAALRNDSKSEENGPTLRDSVHDGLAWARARTSHWPTHGQRVGALALVWVLGSYGLVQLVGPVLVLVFYGSVIAGALVLPLLAILAGAVGYGVPLADLLLWAGLGGLDEPLVDLTADGRYVLKETSSVGLENPPKYKLAKRVVALSCAVTPEAFGRAGYSADEVLDYIPTDGLTADGGAEPPVPPGYTRGDVRYGTHQGYVPTADHLDPGKTYVHSNMWLSRFRDVATGDAVEIAEKEAEKEFAAGDPQFTDEELVKFSAYGAGASILFWVVVGLAF